MTQFEFYKDRHEDAYNTALRIVKSRKALAFGIQSSAAQSPDPADVDLEYCMILREWYSDYCNERV